MPPSPLRDRIATSAFCFRGYNTTNLGRSRELLLHPAYGDIVRKHLQRMTELCADTMGRTINLVERVEQNQETTIETFGDAIGIIVGMELAQLELLEQFHGIAWNKCELAFGYSLGEVTALIATDVYKLEHILPPPLVMADDCIELARNATMGVLFSRGPELDLDLVTGLCLKINNEGRGVIGVSSFLSPNTVLLLGQHETVDRFRELMEGNFPKQAHLRKNKEKWPPLHTPLLWEKNIPNRAAMMMHTMPGGFIKPTPTIVSCVTGKANYSEYNSREILNRWIDHPQRLWDVMCATLSSGVQTVIHVGPEPNLVPATFQRLSDNITSQLSGRGWNSLGRRAIAGISKRPWLTKMLSQPAALLRAPFVEHIILEDWLLSQEVK